MDARTRSAPTPRPTWSPALPLGRRTQARGRRGAVELRGHSWNPRSDSSRNDCRTGENLPMSERAERFTTGVLVIGAAAAGLRASIELAERGLGVLCLAKRSREDAHTVLAAGGINAALATTDPLDSPAQHAADTLSEGYWLNDPRAVEILATEAPRAIEELDRWGAASPASPATSAASSSSASSARTASGAPASWATTRAARSSARFCAARASFGSTFTTRASPGPSRRAAPPRAGRTARRPHDQARARAEHRASKADPRGRRVGAGGVAMSARLAGPAGLARARALLGVCCSGTDASWRPAAAISVTVSGRPDGRLSAE